MQQRILKCSLATMGDGKLVAQKKAPPKRYIDQPVLLCTVFSGWFKHVFSCKDVEICFNYLTRVDKHNGVRTKGHRITQNCINFTRCRDKFCFRIIESISCCVMLNALHTFAQTKNVILKSTSRINPSNTRGFHPSYSQCSIEQT